MTTEWHGWAMGDAQLSVAPHPDNARAFALILSVGGDHEIVGEFYTQSGAADTMAFLDGAFSAAAQANRELLRYVEMPGG